MTCKSVTWLDYWNQNWPQHFHKISAMSSWTLYEVTSRHLLLKAFSTRWYSCRQLQAWYMWCTCIIWILISGRLNKVTQTILCIHYQLHLHGIFFYLCLTSSQLCLMVFNWQSVGVGLGNGKHWQTDFDHNKYCTSYNNCCQYACCSIHDRTTRAFYALPCYFEFVQI